MSADEVFVVLKQHRKWLFTSEICKEMKRTNWFVLRGLKQLLYRDLVQRKTVKPRNMNMWRMKKPTTTENTTGGRKKRCRRREPVPKATLTSK